MLTDKHILLTLTLELFEGTMEIIARHFETLRACYDGSRRGTKVYDNDVDDETNKFQERLPREANLFIF